MAFGILTLKIQAVTYIVENDHLTRVVQATWVKLYKQVNSTAKSCPL